MSTKTDSTDSDFKIQHLNQNELIEILKINQINCFDGMKSLSKLRKRPRDACVKNLCDRKNS